MLENKIFIYRIKIVGVYPIIFKTKGKALKKNLYSSNVLKVTTSKCLDSQLNKQTGQNAIKNIKDPQSFWANE